MPIDAPVVACLAQEINKLLPVKIDKIHQPHPDEFLFSCYGGGLSFKLLFSLHAKYGRFHTLENSKSNPPAPSPFCMLLRKHFGGAKLIQVGIPIPFERIARFVFETFDPVDGLTQKHIYLELTGKSANLILTHQSGDIIDSWRKTAPRPGEREIGISKPYQFPSTKGRWAPVTLEEETFLALLASLGEHVTLEQFLAKHWYGLSPLAVRQIILSAGLDLSRPCPHLSAPEASRLFITFYRWAEALRENVFNPCGIYDNSGHLKDYSAFWVEHAPENCEIRPLSSLQQVMAEQVESIHENARFQEAKRNLQHKITSQLEKNQKKQAKQQTEAAEAKQGDQWRICGELLTTYGFQVKKGSKSTSLPNHYNPEGAQLTIELNPALTAQENAQAYFKKYQKAKKGRLAIAAQLEKTAATIAYWESLDTMAASALSISDLDLVREECDSDSGPGGKRHRPGVKPHKTPVKESAAKPRQFLTPDGHQILVGRNNIQNDKLTFKIAAPGDLWFHTQKIPGSHVILKARPGTIPDEESLHYACQIAVFFSKGRASTKVPVDYTQRKYVKKPQGAAPGFVIYDEFKTAIITPDPMLLEKFGLRMEQE